MEQQAAFDEFVAWEEVLLELLLQAGFTQTEALKVLGLAKSTLHYRRHPRPKKTDHQPRPAPPKTLSQQDRQQVMELLRAGQAEGLSVEKVYFKHLNSDAPLLASLRTFYRINKELKTTPPPIRQRRPRPRQQPREITATRPGEVLCWDITWLPGSYVTKGFHLYTVLDLYSRKIVGYTVQLRQDQRIATELIQQVIAAEALNDSPVRVVHTDNGAVMTSNQMRRMLNEHDVELSLIRPGVSNDNPFEESSHRTLKHHRLALSCYPDLHTATDTISRIIDSYNHHDPHSGLAGYTPQQVYTGAWEQLHQHRKTKEEAYYTNHPERRPSRSMFQPPPESVSITIGTPKDE